MKVYGSHSLHYGCLWKTARSVVRQIGTDVSYELAASFFRVEARRRNPWRWRKEVSPSSGACLGAGGGAGVEVLRYTRKVAGSIPDGVIGIFHWRNPFGRTVALGLTQPPTEMSTRNISWGGKGGRCVGLTTLPPSCADFLEIWDPQPPGILRACPGL